MCRATVRVISGTCARRIRIELQHACTVRRTRQRYVRGHVFWREGSCGGLLTNMQGAVVRRSRSTIARSAWVTVAVDDITFCDYASSMGKYECGAILSMVDGVL